MSQYASEINDLLSLALGKAYEIQQKSNLVFGKYKLDLVDISFLKQLNRASMTIKALTEVLVYDRTEVAKRVNRLISFGLAEKKVLPEDKRSTCIYLTEKGKKCARQSEQRLDECLFAALEGFSLKEEKVIMTYLKQLYDSLDTLTD